MIKNIKINFKLIFIKYSNGQLLMKTTIIFKSTLKDEISIRTFYHS